MSMSDTPATCTRFETWLLEAGETRHAGAWAIHLDACHACRTQWQAHVALAAVFAAEPAPRLSPTFRVRLPRDSAPAPIRRPLSGWRQAAMIGYVVGALAVLVWTLRGVPTPTVDTSSPWLAVGVLLAVPVTLGLAIVASRWLPLRRVGTGPTLTML